MVDSGGSSNEAPSMALNTKILAIQGTIQIIKELLKWGSIFGIFYFGFDCLKQYAGKQTVGNLSFLAVLKIDQVLAYTMAGGGVMYGKSQNKRRKAEAKRLGSRIEALELERDPQRTSSGLPRTDAHLEEEDP